MVIRLAAVLLLVPAQDPPEAVRACEALFDRLTDLDPEVRAAARLEFRKVARKDALADPHPAARVALGLLGEPSVAKDLLPLLDGEASPLTRAAAEASGEPAAEKLLKLLDHDDLRLAMAAARSLGRMKAAPLQQKLQDLATDSARPRRRALAAYALGYLPPLLTVAEHADDAARDAAWAALGDVPAAAADLRMRIRQEEAFKATRELFEKKPATPGARASFGRLLIRAGLYRGPELAELALRPEKELAAWAADVALDPKLVRRCVTLGTLVRLFGGYEKEADATKAPIPALEALLAAAGLKVEGADLKERTSNARAAWERTRMTSIDRDVNPAIDDGVALLKSRRLEDGSWKFCVCGAHEGDQHRNGTTALVAYTLLKCGVPVRDKLMTGTLDWLLGEAVPNHTYSVGLQAMALAEAVALLQPPPKTPRAKFPPEDLAAITRYSIRLRDCAAWLVEAQTRVNRGGLESGDWGYTKTPTDDMDNSNHQFASLGLRSAANAGVPIPGAAWVRSMNHWQADQNKDGSWPYRRDKKNPNPGGTRSMTAAGLYGSLVAKASLRKKPAELLALEDPFKKGLAYFAKHYPVPEARRDRSGGHVHSPYYDLYSLERAMLLSGTEKIDGRPWYHDGALFILGNQGLDGEWIDTTDTCLALLFLKKAYVAVATGDNR